MDLKQSGGSNRLKKRGNSTDMAEKASQKISDENFCSRCDRTLDPDEKGEHDDWHFAKDLQAQEDDGGRAPTSPAPATTKATINSPRLDSKQADDSKSVQLPAYAPPSNPPPRGGASRAAARHHTNQVIEAAKVRARDEVRPAINCSCL